MATEPRTMEARAAAHKPHGSGEAEGRKIRRAWRTIINSGLVKGNPGISREQRELVENAGKVIAKALESGKLGDIADDRRMRARMAEKVNYAAGFLGNAAYSPSPSRAEGIVKVARAMQMYDYDAVMDTMSMYSFSSAEHEIATILAAITMKLPTPETRGVYGDVEYIHDVRNIILTYSDQLLIHHTEIGARIMEYVEQLLKSREPVV